MLKSACFVTGLLTLFGTCSGRLVDHLLDNRIASEHSHRLDPFVRRRFILDPSRSSDQCIHLLFEACETVFYGCC